MLTSTFTDLSINFILIGSLVNIMLIWVTYDSLDSLSAMTESPDEHPLLHSVFSLEIDSHEFVQAFF